MANHSQLLPSNEDATLQHPLSVPYLLTIVPCRSFHFKFPLFSLQFLFQNNPNRAKMLPRNLPQDLLLEILARLPVKSLLRFKCVSKSFFNLISDPIFVTKQLECSNSAAKSQFKHPIVFHLDAVKRNPYISLLPDEKSELPENLELPFAEKDLGYVIPYGHCNGIFCLYGGYSSRDSVRKDNLVLWNPATRRVKVVPSPHILPTNAVLESYVHGFGFDPKTKDFKIVSMIMKFNREDDEFPSAEVYNLSTDSWRILDVKVPAYSLRYPKSGSCLNGIYHWLTNDHNDKAILCFDLSNEVFHKMKLPQPGLEGRINEGEFIRDKNVAVIDDHIAYAVVCCNEVVDCYFEVWIMNEYNVEESWTRKFKIGAIPQVDLFLGFWDEGEILAADENGFLVRYNYYTHCVQKFPIHVEPVMFHSFNYLESIVPL